MTKKILTFVFLLAAVLLFATWQYRLLSLLFAVMLNKAWIKSRFSHKYAYRTVVGFLMTGIFIAIPNYFQRGSTQLKYLDENGEEVHTPLMVYAINALLPEEEVANMGIKAVAIMPSGFGCLGGRLVEDAKKDCWSGKMLSFYHPYNSLSMTGSNPGSFVYGQVWNELSRSNLDGIYITDNRKSDKPCSVIFFCHGYLGSWELYQGVFNGLEDCLVVSIGTRDLSGIFTRKDIGKIFTKYIPYLKSQGYDIDESRIHLVGLSNGGTAADVALGHYSDRLNSVTYISTGCHVTKHTKTNVLLIGGGRDSSSSGLPSAAKRLSACGTNVKLYYEPEENHYILVHKSDEVIEMLNSQLGK